MKQLFVAWQDDSTREWIPVARLEKLDEGYRLSYTRGAKKCARFAGLGRMVKLEETYFSKDLFPFFSNRVISKSRPEYKKYLEWLCLDDSEDTPMTTLGITGGLRMTDPFELIPVPSKVGNQMCLDFFPRGIKYMPPAVVEAISKIKSGTNLYLMKDCQNSHDHSALALRTDDPKMMIGYIARYFCSGLIKILDKHPEFVTISVKKVNTDAPTDMRILCTLRAPWQGNNLPLIELADDFLPLEKPQF